VRRGQSFVLRSFNSLGSELCSSLCAFHGARSVQSLGSEDERRAFRAWGQSFVLPVLRSVRAGGRSSFFQFQAVGGSSAARGGSESERLVRALFFRCARSKTGRSVSRGQDARRARGETFVPPRSTVLGSPASFQRSTTRISERSRLCRTCSRNDSSPRRETSSKLSIPRSFSSESGSRV
jgi:hypothetical protein